jgi:hypothetical protein
MPKFVLALDREVTLTSTQRAYGTKVLRGIKEEQKATRKQRTQYVLNGLSQVASYPMDIGVDFPDGKVTGARS